MFKKIIAVVVFFIMVFSLVGCDRSGEPDSETYIGSATDRVAMLSALEGTRQIDSYTETTRLVAFTNGQQDVDMTQVFKYQVEGDKTIAEGYLAVDNEITQRLYLADGYMYVWSMYSQEGAKVFVGTEITALSSISNSIDFSAEAIEQLGAFGLIVTKTKTNTIYSFSIVLEGDGYGDDRFSYDYKVTVETASNKLLEVAADMTMLLSNGDITITSIFTSYDYTPVTVILPDDLDTYISLW